MWWKANTAYHPEYTKFIVKHNALGNLDRVHWKMDGAKYSSILEEILLHSAKDLRLGLVFTFQQDNDLQHKAGVTIEWLKGQRQLMC